MTKFERQRRRLLATIAVLSVILVSLCSAVYAKYVKTDTISGTLNITADIGNISVKEHLYIQNADGSYSQTDTLLPNGSNIGNEYVLIPGVDIPKDPFVVVEKPNDIPVYIFLIINEAPKEDTVTWVMENDWQHIPLSKDHYSGSGWVYVYTGSGTDPAVVTDSMPKIPVLKNNQIIVSQFLLQPDGGKIYTSQTISFTAYMYQVASVDKSGQTDLQHAIDVFLANYNSGT